MHPAASVILFTTASGVGYGILALTPLLTAYGVLPQGRWLGIALLAPALGLVTIGLLASTFHLGHPERAWRALSQWKSSWLSREGVLAILSFPPALLYAYAWIVLEQVDGPWVWAGFATTLTAVATLFTTGMIYRSLKPIPAWATDWTVAGYLSLGLLTGLAVIAAVAAGFGLHPVRFQSLALVLVITSAIIKNAYWARMAKVWDERVQNFAAGVASPGTSVKSIEWPHTEANFVVKEMGYRVARKHADKLRHLARVLLLWLPAGTLVLLPSIVPMPYLSWVLMPTAGLILLGVVVERWLFFAEAKHVVSLYYGLD